MKKQDKINKLTDEDLELRRLDAKTRSIKKRTAIARKIFLISQKLRVLEDGHESPEYKRAIKIVKEFADQYNIKIRGEA